MSLTQKVAFNTVSQIVGKVISTGLSLVLIAALTRYLGVAGFGNYTIIFSYVGFAAVLADFGFFWIMVREISKDDKNLEKIVNNVITMRAIMGLVVFTLAFLVSFFIPQYSWEIKVGIAIIGLGWFWTTVNSCYVGVFQSQFEMYKSAITEVIGRIIIFSLVLIFIKLHYSLNMILLAYTAGNFVNFIASMIFGNKYVHFKLSFNFRLWKKIFKEALPMGIVLILSLIYFRIDSVMLSLMKSNVDVGIYGAPYKILEVLLVFPSIFMGNVFPIITRYLKEKDERLESAIQKSFDFLVIAALPIIAGTIILSKQIIGLVAGQEFVTTSTLGSYFGQPATSVLILQILIFAIGFSFLSTMFNNTVIALGKQKELIWTYVTLVFVNVVLNLILIPNNSYIGAAIATVITEILVLILTIRIVYKHIKPNIKLDIIVRALAASVGMAIILYSILNLVNIFVVTIIGIISYIILLYVFGGFKPEIMKLILKKE